MRKSAAFHMVYVGANAVFPLILSMYLSRVLGAEGMGQVAFGRNLVSYFTLFSGLGMMPYAMRELGKEEEKEGLFWELAAVSGGIGAVSAAFCFGFLALYHPGEGFLWVLGLEAVVLIFDVSWYFAGKEDFLFLVKRSVLEKLLTLGLVAAFVGKPEDLVRYCWILAAGKGAGMAYALGRMGHFGPFSWDATRTKGHLRGALSLAVTGAAAGLYSRVDISMLGWLASAESVGYYANAHKIVNIVLALATAATAVFLPRLSREAGTENFEKTLGLGLRTALVLSVPAAVGLFLVSEDVTVCLFGAEFLPGAAALRILSAVVPVKAVGDMGCYQVLVSRGQEKILPKVYLLACLLNVGLNVRLIPGFSHAGAALASLAGEVLVVAVLVPVVRKLARPRVGGRFLLGLLAGTVAMAGAVLAVQRNLEMGMPRLCLSVGAGAAVYFGVMAPVWRMYGGSCEN